MKNILSNSLLPLPEKVVLLDGESWWGGRTGDGIHMPFTSGSSHRTVSHSDQENNQGAPFLVSSHGRYLWSERPFVFEFSNGEILLTGSVHQVLLSEGHGNLAGAYRAASKAHFPPSGQIPPTEFFSVPQYNTWIELNHHQTQAGALDYARALIQNGYPPGVFMIDAGWEDYFGHLDFNAAKFPNPRAMIQELNELGFKTMLWVSPFLSSDSREYRLLRDRPGWLLRNQDGTPAILEWWDGYSAHLDVTHPEAVEWFHEKLRRLQKEYGVDGFKFDAGDTKHYKNRPASWLDAAPVDLTEAWARIGLEYPFNEYRACWKLAGKPLVQRLQDKSPHWDETGLGALIPNTIAGGLIGHPFMCPDLIAGGDYAYFNRPDYQVDEEFFIRAAQTASLFPMMQFSSAPWRVLSKEGNALCRAAALLHQKFGKLFLAEATASAHSGDPILRPLEFEFPQAGYAAIKDQFLIGRTLLVAPALKPGMKTREVTIPPGVWVDDRGESITGPAEIAVETPLDRLPHWLLQSASGSL